MVFFTSLTSNPLLFALFDGCSLSSRYIDKLLYQLASLNHEPVKCTLIKSLFFYLPFQYFGVRKQIIAIRQVGKGRKVHLLLFKDALASHFGTVIAIARCCRTILDCEAFHMCIAHCDTSSLDSTGVLVIPGRSADFDFLKLKSLLVSLFMPFIVAPLFF